MPELPGGAVTLLFTDIEGSTGLLEELGEGLRRSARRAPVRPARRVPEAWRRRGEHAEGRLLLCLERANDAVSAAAAGQHALAGGRIKVRMGLHTGEPTAMDGDYLGPDVERYEERLTFTLRRRSLYAERLDPVAEAHRDRWEAGRGLETGAAVGYALSLD